MNKSIKTELDNLINSQTPDLWDRIEASLPEKSGVAFVGTERMAQAEGYGNNKQNHLSKKNKKWYPVYGTVGVAACLCVVIFALSKNNLLLGTNMTETAEYTADYLESKTAEESDSAEITYESAEGYGETNYEEAEYEESDCAGVTNNMSEELAEEEFTASDFSDNVRAEESASEATGEMDGKDSQKLSNSVADVERDAEMESEKEKAVQSKIEELSKQGLTIHENVSVKVDCRFEEAVEGELIIIYEVTLLKGTEFIEEGTTIQLKTDPLFEDSLKEGEIYQITFYDNKPPYDSSNHEYFLLKY